MCRYMFRHRLVQMALGFLISGLLVVAGSTEVRADSASHVHYGNSNIKVTPTASAPGGILSVKFDYKVYHSHSGSWYANPWEIRLDGTTGNRDGTLLARGAGVDWFGTKTVTFHVSTTVTIPASTTPGVHTLKIITCCDANWGSSYRRYSYVTISLGGPTLSWVGAVGYRRDCHHPNTGTPDSTVFHFKVLLTASSGLEPHYVKLFLRRNGFMWKKIPMTGSGDPVTTGRVYSTSMKLPVGNYAYRIKAEDDGGLAGGEPTDVMPGPVMDAPCFLRWGVDPGYNTDGVEPDSGDPSTRFVFKVIYKNYDGDMPYYVRLTLWRNGSYHRSWRCRTTDPSPDPTWPGVVYKKGTRLPPGSYEYQFTARDPDGMADGPGTARMSGPTVSGNPPVLSWTGEPGFTDRGVDPLNGVGGALYTFRVKLTDAEGDEPIRMKLKVRKDGRTYRYVDMTPGTGSTASGRIYSYQLTCPTGNYGYRFFASDRDGPATGEPTIVHQGPIMPAPPYVQFPPDPGFEGDGVDPDSGVADTTRFEFRALYKNHDGDMPKYVKVFIYRNGLLWRRREMYQMPGGDPVSPGLRYSRTTKLPAGTYQYKFVARDVANNRAIGPGTVKTAGPVVTGGATSAGAAVSALSAAPTRAGAQITFSLACAGQVQARILNVAGRPIKTLCHARDCDAGTNTLLWNAQADNGLAVPNGMYVVEVVAKAADGTQSRAVGQVRVSR